MSASNNPLAPDPETNIDSQQLPDPPPQEDLTKPVPIGEPDDEGYVIEEEDPEYGPPDEPDRRRIPQTLLD